MEDNAERVVLECAQCHKQADHGKNAENRSHLDDFYKVSMSWVCGRCVLYDKHPKHSWFRCANCNVYDYKNANYIQEHNFVYSSDSYGGRRIHHVMCPHKVNKCSVCKYDMDDGEECVDMFVDYGRKIKYHKRCVEHPVIQKDVCQDCNRSFFMECTNCGGFQHDDCYNNDCSNYVVNIANRNGCDIDTCKDDDRLYNCCGNCVVDNICRLE